MRAQLEEPLEIDAMGSWQVTKCHAPSLFGEFDHSFVVFCNDENCVLLRLASVCELFRRIEELGVRIKLDILGHGGVCFHFLGRRRSKQF